MLDDALDLDREREPAVREVCGFLSLHWRTWRAMPRPPSRPELVGYAASTRHLPLRTSHAGRWLEDAQRWLDATPHGEWRGRLFLGGQRTLPGLAGGEGPGWWVKPLRSFADLVNEGREQRNCLRGVKAGELLPGPVRTSYYAARVGQERLTVSVTIAGTMVRLEQALKAANHAPAASSLQAIRTWLAARAPAAGLTVVED